MTSSALFRSLNEEMLAHPFLSNNPLLSRVSQTGSTEELAQALRQYVRLPEEIVSYLKAAAAWFPVDHPIHRELERNWSQELGSATGGVPHAEILKVRLVSDLGIDATLVVSNLATEQFLTALRDGMRRSAWFAVGQTYALEASAVPELALLVGPAINLYATRVGRAQPIGKAALRSDAKIGAFPVLKTRAEALALPMSDWFALHVLDFEVGHRDLLQQTVLETEMNGQAQTEFVQGFRTVLSAMDTWWSEIEKNPAYPNS